ncbi:hypothetical protein VTK73DRAFT_6278 [Phialemonium thermophilum]|uniref:Uncharacterized protein n=1 Tax=Phialemonium thermophilum TaxID=223376 RepID=A0ABR3WJZ5_9PEZI
MANTQGVNSVRLSHGRIQDTLQAAPKSGLTDDENETEGSYLGEEGRQVGSYSISTSRGQMRAPKPRIIQCYFTSLPPAGRAAGHQVGASHFPMK